MALNFSQQEIHQLAKNSFQAILLSPEQQQGRLAELDVHVTTKSVLAAYN